MVEVKTDTVFAILSQLMDETIEENSVIESLNDIQIIVEEKLIPSIEKIQYENKYELIESIRGICKDISLYLYFPEMINKVSVGLHEPTDAVYKSIYKNFFDKTFKGEITDRPPGTSIFSDEVPVVIHAEPNQGSVKCLNLAEKAITLSNKEYLELLNYSKDSGVDLAGLLYCISIPTERMIKNQIYITIPKNIDIHKKYCLPVKNAIDVLVVQAKKCKAQVLKEYKNISKICVYGKFQGEDLRPIEKYCEENSISLKCFNTVVEALNELKKNRYTDETNNFCYMYYLENILYEITWYLSVRKSELEEPLSEINENLLYKDENSYDCVKKLQRKYSNDINQITELYDGYQNICSELLDKIKLMQKNRGIKENVSCINQHVKMEGILLELILKLSEIYKEFPVENSKAKIRMYCYIYKQVSGKNEAADVILNDFLGEKQSQKDLDTFKKMQLESTFFKRKKLALSDKLFLDLKSCADIVLSLGVPLRNVERRILGEYYLSKGDKKRAQENLRTAMIEGDDRAGEIIANKIKVSEQMLQEMADFGVKSAAFKVGKKLYYKSRELPKNENKKQYYDESLKYLHIAASKRYLEAIKLLGDISYEHYEGNDSTAAEKALHYYLLAEKYGSADQKLKERIGDLYYQLGDYKKSISYCEKADTAACSYLLGLIYENGNGCAADENKALMYYEKAMDAGHMEAQVTYERLNAKIEARKKKEIIKENTSYSSYSYQSGYYGYYSGW